MTPTSPSPAVSYPPLKGVLHFLKFDKREELARKASIVRTLHINLPILLDSFHYTHGFFPFHFSKNDLRRLVLGPEVTTIQLNSVKWQFIVKKKFVRVFLPSGKEVTLEGSHEVVQRFLDYYLGRPGTHIRQMTIENYNEPTPFVLKNCPKIDFLKLEITDSNHKTGVLGSLKDNKFKSIDISDSCEYQESSALLTELKEIKTDGLNLRTLETFQTQLLDLNPRKMAICERTIDADTFFKMCEKFKNEKFEVGSSYYGMVRQFIDGVHRPLDEDAYWRRLKNELGCEERYLGERECLAAPIEGTDSELIVEVQRTLYPVKSCFYLKVQVAKAGTTKLLGNFNPIDLAFSMLIPIRDVPYRLLYFFLVECHQPFHTPHFMLFFNVCLLIGAINAAYRHPSDELLCIFVNLLRRLACWSLIAQTISTFEQTADRIRAHYSQSVQWRGFIRVVGCCVYMYGMMLDTVVNEPNMKLSKEAVLRHSCFPDELLSLIQSFRRAETEYGIDMRINLGWLAPLFMTYALRVYFQLAYTLS